MRIVFELVPNKLNTEDAQTDESDTTPKKKSRSAKQTA